MSKGVHLERYIRAEWALFCFVYNFIRKVRRRMNLLEGEVRIPSGCAIAAVISRKGNKMSGEKITESMKPMHDRSNGLGGGFAGIRNLSGIYGFLRVSHVFTTIIATARQCEDFLKEGFEIVKAEIYSDEKNPRDYRCAAYMAVFRHSASICACPDFSLTKRNMSRARL